MGSDFTDLHKQGSDLGKLLENGEADKARKGYDALILRIQDETRDKPVDRERRIDEVHAGMAQADPTDVKSPGNGTDKGYYIYWNTENLVTESIDKISAFCRGHNNCQSLDGDQQKRAASSYVMPQEVANAPLWSQRDASELNSLLTDTNNWLYKMLPDGLERYTFKDDFNRRRSKSGLEAVMDDSLSVVIREKEQ